MRKWFIYFIPLILLTIYSCDLPFGIKLASSYATPTFDSPAATEAMRGASQYFGRGEIIGQ
jgi:hypothetical protein